jgi:molecular chaperone GrpE
MVHTMDENNPQKLEPEDASPQPVPEPDQDLEVEYEDIKKVRKDKNAAPAEEDDFVPEDGEGNTKDTIATLRDRLKKALAEKQEYLDGWQRMKADFVNARKREEEARKDIVRFANENLILELVPVLDSFTMAFANKEAWEKVEKNWRVGVEYIYSQLVNTLTQNGFKEFDPLGEPFDPNNHVAVESVPVQDKSQDHVVVEVIQKGYILNDKIIRPAHVRIGEYKK